MKRVFSLFLVLIVTLFFNIGLFVNISYSGCADFGDYGDEAKEAAEILGIQSNKGIVKFTDVNVEVKDVFGGDYFDDFNEIVENTQKWNRTNKVDGVGHTLIGDVGPHVLISGGLHTSKGLDHFLTKAANSGVKPNSTPCDLKLLAESRGVDVRDLAQIEELPNGVKRVTMPEEAFNAKQWEKLEDAGIPGGKSLFPDSWGPRDIVNAANKIYKNNNITPTTTGLFEDVINNVKVNIAVTKGKTVSTYPSWVQ